MLLVPARQFQTLHRSTVIFGADVALRAVLRDNVRETRGHDEDGQAGGGTPGVVDAEGGVIAVCLEIDVAAILGPDAGHAVASLVGAEGSGRGLSALEPLSDAGGMVSRLTEPSRYRLATPC